MKLLYFKGDALVTTAIATDIKVLQMVQNTICSLPLLQSGNEWNLAKAEWLVNDWYQDMLEREAHPLTRGSSVNGEID